MRPKDPLSDRTDRRDPGVARPLGRGLAALILAALAAGQQASDSPAPDLARVIDSVDALLAQSSGPDAREQALRRLERGLAQAPESDPEYPWALQLKAELLLAADRCQGVFELCQRAALLNEARIEAARRDPADRGAEIEARTTAIQIAHQQFYLWEHLGLVDRLAEAAGEEARQCEELRKLAAPGEVLGALLTSGFDATRLALAQQRTDDALANCRKLRALLEQPGMESDPAQRLLVDLQEASAQHDRCMEGRLEFESARQSLLELVDRAERDPGIAHDALLLLVELELANGHWQAAREHLDRIRAIVSPADASGASFDVPLENATRALAFEARLALETQAPHAELVRCRDALAQSIGTTLERWLATPPPAAGLGVLLWGTQRASLAALVDLEVALDEASSGAERALQALLDVQEVGTLARRLGCAGTTLAAVRGELLADGSACLIYLPAPDRTQAFVLTSATLDAPLRLASQDALQEALAPWLEIANAPRPDAGEAAEAARRLEDFVRLGSVAREKLLPDALLARLAGCRHVYVLGTEILRRFPIEMLPLADGTPFGARFAVSRLPSLPVGVHLARTQAECSLEATLVAAPLPGAEARRRWSEVAELPLERAEIERLWQGEEGAGVRRFLGPEARLDARAIESLAQSRLGLVLAHGAWNARVERPPTLLLTPLEGGDGLVGCAELEALPRTPAFFELIACGSGRGRSRFGDDCNSLLPSALYLRGTCCVLQTTTNVPLHSTVAFASAVNARLRSRGESMAEAVRAVREEFWRDPRHRDPADWGGLVVEGLGARAVFETRGDARPGDATEPGRASESRTGLVWAGLAALGLSALLAWQRLRRRGA